MILHKTTLRRAEPLSSDAVGLRRVKVLGTGAIEYWRPGDLLDLPRSPPATDEEIRLAIGCGLTIRQVREARKGCVDCECGACKARARA